MSRAGARASAGTRARGGGAWVVGGAGDPTGRAGSASRASRPRATPRSCIGSVRDIDASRVARRASGRCSARSGASAASATSGATRSLAEGAAEAMVESDLYPWDLAAPWVLVEEAGGRITDFDGRRSLDAGRGIRRRTGCSTSRSSTSSTGRRPRADGEPDAFVPHRRTGPHAVTRAGQSAGLTCRQTSDILRLVPSATTPPEGPDASLRRGPRRGPDRPRRELSRPAIGCRRSRTSRAPTASAGRRSARSSEASRATGSSAESTASAPS